MVEAEQKGFVGAHGVRIAEVIPITGMRKMMADHMINSHLSCARVTILEEMDVGKLVDLKNQLMEDQGKTAGIKISMAPDRFISSRMIFSNLLMDFSPAGR